MAKKPMHPARKTLRYILYGCLAASFLFISSVVYLRMNYHHLRDNPELRNKIFHASVLQHKAQAAWANDKEDIAIIRELFRRSFFSSIYKHAAMDMLETKADEGYAPAQTLHADIILAYRHTDSPEKDATYYYNLAAAQDYAPAIEKLSLLHPEKDR